jgi:hypothetical protein
VSRSKEAVYRQSGEEVFDQAGSPSTRQTERKDQAEAEPEAVGTPLHPPREH